MSCVKSGEDDKKNVTKRHTEKNKERYIERDMEGDMKKDNRPRCFPYKPLLTFTR